MSRRKFLNTYNLVVIAIMTAMSLVLSEFPKLSIFPVAPFLEVDFSDLPIIFSAFFIHPLAAVFISLIKNVAGLASSTTMFVGEFSNFTLSCVYSLTASVIFMRKRTRVKVLISCLISILAVTVGAMASNYFVMLPLYMKIYEFHIPEGFNMASFLFAVILPFNLIKFGLCTTAFFTLYLSLEKIFYKFKPEVYQVVNVNKFSSNINKSVILTNSQTEEENKL